jgi:hypothetical protein
MFPALAPVFLTGSAEHGILLRLQNEYQGTWLHVAFVTGAWYIVTASYPASDGGVSGWRRIDRSIEPAPETPAGFKRRLNHVVTLPDSVICLPGIAAVAGRHSHRRR